MSESEPRFFFPKLDTLIEARAKAKATISQFRGAFAERRHKGAYYGVKIHFPRPNGEEGSHVWLQVHSLLSNLYFCSPTELPSDFVGLKIGETKLAEDHDVEDWMILDDGILYGGFSLRVIREQVPASERAGFDAHMGVTRYADENAA